MTDLPGIYSLDSANDANSIDESIASSAISSMPADLIINVVDATSLERSLYMTLQLRELGRPMVVVLNKLDALHRERQEIDVEALSKNSVVLFIFYLPLIKSKCRSSKKIYMTCYNIQKRLDSMGWLPTLW